MTIQSVPQIRVFIASPGDVNEERAVALQVLDILEYDPRFRQGGIGGVSIHAVAWDKEGSGTAMRASMTPQTAIRAGLPQPSECDIVLVFFWGRVGTPLPYPEYQKDDGTPYLSGTEWEYLNAITAERAHGKPVTLVYKRIKKPRIDLDNAEQVAQYQAVQTFFKQFRDPATSALVGGFNEYKTPEELKVLLLLHLPNIVSSILNSEDLKPSAGAIVPERSLVDAPPLWTGSPFPGLRSFTEADAPIFFGRGQETSDLVSRVEESRFVAVVAASGSGKSSLVAAGLIPRLKKANAIVSGATGSKDWRFVRFTPGQEASPFAALFSALRDAFPEYKVDPFELPSRRKSFVESITADPASFVEVCDALLSEAKAPVWAEILFFVDQFEELFTLVREQDRAPFVALLEAIFASRRLRCVVTMRSDFTAQAIDNPTLAKLMNQGNYMLAVPTAGALIEMIKRPAERAGLTWEEGLPERIQSDTGSDTGALALMAYALDELYQAAGDKYLTFAAYNALGDPTKNINGVEGAIGKRAEIAFEKMDLPNKDGVLQRVFRELVTVDERGTATRQRALLSKFDMDERALIDSFASERLLVTEDDRVEVAHEAVFRSWERLKKWIEDEQEDLILLRQMRSTAAEWKKKGTPDLLWTYELQKPVFAMIARHQPKLDEHERQFMIPEYQRLLDELRDPKTSPKRRRTIGERLAALPSGDPRRAIGVEGDVKAYENDVVIETLGDATGLHQNS
ncbi:MAG: ATP-binding protein [Anaerolinea sp.]|nr:ATP-binding protein [Anaerolinea sp.]